MENRSFFLPINLDDIYAIPHKNKRNYERGDAYEIVDGYSVSDIILRYDKTIQTSINDRCPVVWCVVATMETFESNRPKHSSM